MNNMPVEYIWLFNDQYVVTGLADLKLLPLPTLANGDTYVMSV